VDAFQATLICEVEMAVAVGLPGAPGGVVSGVTPSEKLLVSVFRVAVIVAVVLLLVLTACALNDACVDPAGTKTEPGIDMVAPELI